MLPLEVQLDSETLSLSPDDSKEFNFTISLKPSSEVLGGTIILSPTHDFLNVELVENSSESFQLVTGSPQTIHTIISASSDAIPGEYKILIGTQLSNIAISKYVTVTIE